MMYTGGEGTLDNKLYWSHKLHKQILAFVGLIGFYIEALSKLFHKLFKAL